MLEPLRTVALRPARKYWRSLSISNNSRMKLGIKSKQFHATRAL
jgi:hypothetical protein